jgi:predicted NBD/HSP70 family sugar kinase
VIVGVDVRDHTILTVRANDEGRVVKRDRRPATPDAVIGSLRAVDAHEVAAVGIAVRDPIHSSSELSTAVRAAGLAVTPHLVRHGAATAIAEHWCGAARGATSVVALNVDEGVDAGIVIDGRVIEGSHGLAGRAGWLALHPVEREDYRRLG